MRVAVFARGLCRTVLAGDVVAESPIDRGDASTSTPWEVSMEREKETVWPSVLSGKRALIFAEPFDSATRPSPDLTAEYVKERTGVEMVFRPLEALQEALSKVDESRASAEMERWVEGAAGAVEPAPETILGASKLYLALWDIVQREGLSGVSIDCVRYTFSDGPLLPHPCLAFSRLRDEGVAAPCEADVPAMLTELLLEGVAQKPAFMGNAKGVDAAESTMLLTHCLAPLAVEGYGAEPIPYGLRHYHELERGVAMEVDLPTGRIVTMGAFSDDLASFALWPGRVIETGPGSCQTRVTVRIPDPQRFDETAAGHHCLMVYGDYVAEVADVLAGMNVTVIGPVAGGPSESVA